MSKNYSTLLFDLDGTLTDPFEGISKSVLHALSKYNIVEKDEAVLRKMIGPPLVYSLKKFYNFSEEQCAEAVMYYREYFVKQGIFENKIYEGIPELLKELVESGKTLRLATSKPEKFAKQILEHFSIDHYFIAISGSTFDGTIVEKPQVVAKALESISQDQKATTLMIGDREYDMQGAIANGIDSVGVLYGFGNHEEFKAAKATYIVKDLNELRNLLLSNAS